MLQLGSEDELADPGFPKRGTYVTVGEPTYYFGQFFPKTA